MQACCSWLAKSLKFCDCFSSSYCLFACLESEAHHFLWSIQMKVNVRESGNLRKHVVFHVYYICSASLQPFSRFLATTNLCLGWIMNVLKVETFQFSMHL